MQMLDSAAQNGGSLNADSPSNTYTTAMIFSLAHSYGTPTILSSYIGFTDTDAGAPNGGMPLLFCALTGMLTICVERCGDVHDRRRHERLAVPAPMGRRGWNGRLPQRSWHRSDEWLGVATGGADRLRARRVHIQLNADLS